MAFTDEQITRAKIAREKLEFLEKNPLAKEILIESTPDKSKHPRARFNVKYINGRTTTSNGLYYLTRSDNKKSGRSKRRYPYYICADVIISTEKINARDIYRVAGWDDLVNRATVEKDEKAIWLLENTEISEELFDLASKHKSIKFYFPPKWKKVLEEGGQVECLS